MENTRELWEQLAQLPGGQKDPFDDPYGPTAECFSDNDIVRMFRLGAETRAVDHLSSCKDCQGRVDAFARVAIAGRALVYVPSHCIVKLDDGEVDSVRIQLITKEVAALRQMNVYLSGPFSAETQAIVLDRSGYPSIELHKVKASKDVVRGLRGHMRLTKQLEVRVGTSVDDVRLVGTSNIELARAGAVPAVQ